MKINYHGKIPVSSVKGVLSSFEDRTGKKVILEEPLRLEDLESCYSLPNTIVIVPELVDVETIKYSVNSKNQVKVVIRGNDFNPARSQLPAYNDYFGPITFGSYYTIEDEDEDTPVILAFYYRGVILLNCQLFTKNNSFALAALEFVLTSSLGLIDFSKEEKEEQLIDDEVIVEVIKDIMSKSLKSQIDHLKAEAEHKRATIKDHRLALQKQGSQLGEIEAGLEMLQSNDGAEAKAREQAGGLQELLDNKAYKNISCQDNILRGLTKDINIRGVDMGSYMVNLNLVDGSMSIRAQRSFPKTRNQHPHVNQHGEVCWGERTGTLERLYNQGDIVGCMKLACEFLSSINPSGVYPNGQLSNFEVDEV